MQQWLGHRDWCPTQWGEACDCPCSDNGCPGRDNCTDPECSIAAWLKTQEA
jgi:hypothetical protein